MKKNAVKRRKKIKASAFHDTVVTPLFDTSTYRFRTAEDMANSFAALLGKKKLRRSNSTFIYQRFESRNSKSVQGKLVKIELYAKEALVFGTGMGAIDTTTRALTKQGDVIIYSTPVYGCTDELLRNSYAKFGVKSIAVNTADLIAVEKLIKKYRRRLAFVLIETPANPVIKLTDIGAIVALVKKYAVTGKRAFVVVDNTFMGPVYQKPFKFGADVVLYSATKFLGGHSDLTGGVVLTKDRKLANLIRSHRNIMGSIMAPEICHKLEGHLETLVSRMRDESESAMKIAQFLSQHPKVTSIFYPTIQNLKTKFGREQQAIYQKQCLGPGSIIAFTITGGRKSAFRFLNKLKKFSLAVSLGGNHTLIIHAATSTHAGMPAAVRKQAGINDSLIRLSVGLEPTKMLIKNLKRALSA